MPVAPVCLVLGGHLNYYDRENRSRFSLPLPKPMILREVLEQLGVPAGEIVFVAINGEQASVDALVVPGDRVELYPPMGGG